MFKKSKAIKKFHEFALKRVEEQGLVHYDVCPECGSDKIAYKNTYMGSDTSISRRGGMFKWSSSLVTTSSSSNRGTTRVYKNMGTCKKCGCTWCRDNVAALVVNANIEALAHEFEIRYPEDAKYLQK